MVADWVVMKDCSTAETLVGKLDSHMAGKLGVLRELEMEYWMAVLKAASSENEKVDY